jgi:hypothetical protein
MEEKKETHKCCRCKAYREISMFPGVKFNIEKTVGEKSICKVCVDKMMLNKQRNLHIRKFKTGKYDEPRWQTISRLKRKGVLNPGEGLISAERRRVGMIRIMRCSTTSTLLNRKQNDSQNKNRNAARCN